MFTLIGRLLGAGVVLLYKVVSVGGVKLLTYKVITASGKVVFVTFKLVGAAIVGMLLSNVFMG